MAKSRDILMDPSRALGPQHAASALLLFKTGDLAGAREQADASLVAGYESADLHNLRGILYSQAGLEEAAVSAYERALVIHPQMAIAHCNLAITLKRLGRLDAAMTCWSHAIAADPAFTDPYIALALERISRQEFNEAETLLRQALAIDGRCVPAYTNLGLAFQLRGKLDEATAHAERALAIDPSCVEAWINLGTALHQQRKVVPAVNCFEKALALEPTSVAAKYNLGQALLLLGEFSRGWPLYESRFAWWRQNNAVLPKFNRQRWKGQEIRGLKLLLVAEQGFGDTLQFVRYASVLADMGATVLVECQADLAELLKSVPGVSQVYVRGDALPHYDFFVPLMSMPMMLSTSLETLPRRIPYIAAKPELAAEWKRRLGEGTSMKVGLAWSGNPRVFDYQHSQVNLRRCVPFDICRLLFAVPGVEFFSVQKDKLPHEQTGLFNATELKEFPTALHNFSETAALIDNIDLIVSVDTAVAHLAGAMGKPVWLMSRYDGCWRWLLDRNDSPWYPTMRIFRQPTPGDWRSVIATVAGELAIASARHS